MTHYDPSTVAGVVSCYALSKPDFVVLTIEGAGVRADETRTYSDLWRNGRSVAAGLKSIGIGSGDNVATLLANHAEFVDLMVAGSLLGFVLVPIDPRTRGEKLVYMLSAANCRCVIAGDDVIQELLAVRNKLPALRVVVSLRTDEGKASAEQSRVADVVAYEDISGCRTEGVEFTPASPDDPMELMYTSGTTGDPKSFAMTHRRYCDSGKMMGVAFGLKPEDRWYNGLSLTHANAQAITLGSSLTNAIPCVLSRRFSKSRFWDITRKYGCTVTTLLGGMTTAIYAEPPKPNDADNPIRLIVSAGMPAAIWPDFCRRFGVQLFEIYGTAEGGLTAKPPSVGPDGSVGRPLPSYKYRLVDDAGYDAVKDANGERAGEILFGNADGSPMKVEYYGQPEASARKCVGGWLWTGDVLREDKNGWLFFMYRKGGSIRHNGDFITPAFVEKAIAEAPEVDDVYVYGIPSEGGAPGEKDVVAAVVPKGPAFDVQALFRFCRQKLEPNFVPSHIQLVREIPKTASEKPQDRFLIELLRTDPGSVHSENRQATS